MRSNTRQTLKLEIKNLQVQVADKEVLRGISLTVKTGQLHAIMGPNGSGKSTLAYALMGHPNYQLQTSNSRCQMRIGKKNLIDLSPDGRAKAGLFLALQSPFAISGVSVLNLLRSAYQSIYASRSQTETIVSSPLQNPLLVKRWRAPGMTLNEFNQSVSRLAHLLHLDLSFLHRSIHDGFSGGEKKKIEMLQALVLQPKFAIFDEIDTGLDVDALKLIAKGIKRLKQQGTGILVITHYQRILRFLKPDFVHVLVKGRLVATGSSALAKKIEIKGYKAYGTN